MAEKLQTPRDQFLSSITDRFELHRVMKDFEAIAEEAVENNGPFIVLDSMSENFSYAGNNFIIGGYHNTISGGSNFVIGGSSNLFDGGSNFVIGGSSNLFDESPVQEKVNWMRDGF